MKLGSIHYLTEMIPVGDYFPKACGGFELGYWYYQVNLNFHRSMDDEQSGLQLLLFLMQELVVASKLFQVDED